MAKKKDNQTNWIIKIIFLSFIISFIFSGATENIMPKINLFGGILVLFFVILLGVVFDMIGVAVTSADEMPFHAKSSRKVKEAKVGIRLIKNAHKVSSFCNDVIGDICGIISGSIGVMLITSLNKIFVGYEVIVALVTTSLIASLTIGLKAMGKSFAMRNSTDIIMKFSKVISIFYK